MSVDVHELLREAQQQKAALGCNYEAPTFGAYYPDGTCIDGYMWDLDSCDEPGGGLAHGGDMPCPWCNTGEFLEYSDVRFRGNARQRRVARRVEVKKARAWAEARSSFPPAGWREGART